jgi:protein required for attachment to host cells
MRDYRVLVVTRGQAELYALAGAAAPLRRLASLQNPAAHRRDRDLGAGRPGRVWNRSAGVRHALEQAHGLRESADRRFAQEVATALAGAAGDPARTGIVLVAEPRLLGVYAQLLPRHVAEQVVARVPVNLGKAPAEVLRKRVRAALRAPGPAGRDPRRLGAR